MSSPGCIGANQRVAGQEVLKVKTVHKFNKLHRAIRIRIDLVNAPQVIRRHRTISHKQGGQKCNQAESPCSAASTKTRCVNFAVHVDLPQESCSRAGPEAKSGNTVRWLAPGQS